MTNPHRQNQQRPQTQRRESAAGVWTDEQRSRPSASEGGEQRRREDAGFEAASRPSEERARAIGTDQRKDRWRSHREARREEFVQAALRALAQHGPDFGMEHVAAEAGVTKPVLYRHFTDKADLFLALGRRGTELLFDRLIPALNNEEAPVPRIRRSLDAYFATIEEHPNLYRLLVRRPGSATVPNTVKEDKELIGAALSRLLGDYLRAFDMDSGAAEPWGYGIVGLVQNVGDWWLERRTMSRDAVVEYLTQLIWAGIDGILRQHGVVVDPSKPIEVNQIVKLTRRQSS